MSEYKKAKVIPINPYLELCETLLNEGYRGVSEEKGVVFECAITATRWDAEKQRIIATTDLPNGCGSFVAINLYPGDKKPDLKFHKEDIRLVSA
jgi:hypothetical protein